MNFIASINLPGFVLSVNGKHWCWALYYSLAVWVCANGKSKWVRVYKCDATEDQQCSRCWDNKNISIYTKSQNNNRGKFCYGSLGTNTSIANAASICSFFKYLGRYHRLSNSNKKLSSLLP